MNRFAIVGCGAISDAHAEAIRRNSNAVLAAGVDPVPAARERVEKSWGCPTFASIAELLGGTEIDSACVCAPPALHTRLVRELLEAGIDVLCEKPLATTAADAASLVHEAAARNVTLAVSAKFRFVDELLEARRLIDAGVIGQPVYYEVTFCARVPMNGHWHARPELSGGGVVMDNAPHAFDVLSNVLDGSIAGLRAAFSRPPSGIAVEDTAELQFKTERGTLGRIALSWTYFTKDLDYLVVQGTEGAIRIAWTGGLQRRHGERDWTAFGKPYDKHAAFARQLDAFLGGIPFGDPVEAVALIEEAYRSAAEGRWRRTRVTQPVRLAHTMATS